MVKHIRIIAALLTISILAGAILSFRAIRPPSVVKVKENDTHFKVVQTNSETIQVQFFSDSWTNYSGAGQFGNLTIFGANCLPIDFSSRDSVLTNRICNAERHYYDDYFDSSPVIFMEIQDSFLTSYLAATSMHYGFLGSHTNWFWKPESFFPFLSYDTFKLSKINLTDKIKLEKVKVIESEERKVVITGRFKYYLVRDDDYLGHFADVYADNFENTNLKGFWLFENKWGWVK